MGQIRALLAVVVVAASFAVAGCSGPAGWGSCEPLALPAGTPPPSVATVVPTAAGPTAAASVAPLPDPVGPPVGWDSVPAGEASPVSVAGADGAIHPPGGGSVGLSLPADGRVWEVHRVRGGWVIMFVAGAREFAFVADNGDRRALKGTTGTDVLGVSPDGSHVAVALDGSHVAIYELPTLRTVATLSVTEGQTAGHLNRAHFVGADSVLIGTGRLGDSSGPDRRLIGWNWANGRTVSWDNARVSASFADLAVLVTDDHPAAGLLMRVDAGLTPTRVGCLPSGAWWLSPDGTRLAGLCVNATCSVVLSVAELAAGRAPLVRTIDLPVPASALDWSDDGDLLAAVVLHEEYGRYGWGVIRCAVAGGGCTRAALPTGPTAAAVDVGGIYV